MDGVPSLFSSYAYYNSDKFHFYGEDFMKYAMAYKSFEDAGVHASTGSDFGTPGPFAPLMSIQGMITSKGFNGETWGAMQSSPSIRRFAPPAPMALTTRTKRI